MLIEFFLILAIGCALVAVELKDLLGGAIMLGICGILVGVVFFFLMAPDLAIIQIVIETISTIVIVIGIEKTMRRSAKGSNKIFVLLLILILIPFIVLGLVPGLVPEFGGENIGVSNYYIENGMEETGAENLVTAILLDYRAYDTFGEVMVLFIAVLGCALILRGKRCR